jgi:hypothetical protein
MASAQTTRFRALGGIERLIRLSEQPVRAGIVAGNERRHADTERHMRAGLGRAVRDPQTLSRLFANLLGHLAGPVAVGRG